MGKTIVTISYDCFCAEIVFNLVLFWEGKQTNSSTSHHVLVADQLSTVMRSTFIGWKQWLQNLHGKRMLCNEFAQLRSRKECINFVFVWSNILPHMELGTGNFLCCLYCGVICFLELFGIFLLIGYLPMNMKYRRSLWFTLYSEVFSDIWDFNAKNSIFLLSLSFVAAKEAGEGDPLVELAW